MFLSLKFLRRVRQSATKQKAARQATASPHMATASKPLCKMLSPSMPRLAATVHTQRLHKVLSGSSLCNALATGCKLAAIPTIAANTKQHTPSQLSNGKSVRPTRGISSEKSLTNITQSCIAHKIAVHQSAKVLLLKEAAGTHTPRHTAKQKAAYCTGIATCTCVGSVLLPTHNKVAATKIANRATQARLRTFNPTCPVCSAKDAAAATAMASNGCGKRRVLCLKQDTAPAPQTKPQAQKAMWAAVAPLSKSCCQNSCNVLQWCFWQKVRRQKVQQKNPAANKARLPTLPRYCCASLPLTNPTPKQHIATLQHSAAVVCHFIFSTYAKGGAICGIGPTYQKFFTTIFSSSATAAYITPARAHSTMVQVITRSSLNT